MIAFNTLNFISVLALINGVGLIAFSMHFFMAMLGELNGNRDQAHQIHLLTGLRHIRGIASEHSAKFPRSTMRRNTLLFIVGGVAISGLSIATLALT